MVHHPFRCLQIRWCANTISWLQYHQRHHQLHHLLVPSNWHCTRLQSAHAAHRHQLGRLWRGSAGGCSIIRVATVHLLATFIIGDPAIPLRLMISLSREREEDSPTVLTLPKRASSYVQQLNDRPPLTRRIPITTSTKTAGSQQQLSLKTGMQSSPSQTTTTPTNTTPAHSQMNTNNTTTATTAALGEVGRVLRRLPTFGTLGRIAPLPDAAILPTATASVDLLIVILACYSREQCYGGDGRYWPVVLPQCNNGCYQSISTTKNALSTSWSYFEQINSQCSSDVFRDGHALHVLINNAGVMRQKKEEMVDGLEIDATAATTTQRRNSSNNAATQQQQQRRHSAPLNFPQAVGHCSYLFNHPSCLTW